MNRFLPYVGVTIVLAVVFLTAIPATTYTYAVKELAQTFTALQTFANGITLTGTTQAVPASGVFMRYDSASQCYQIYKDQVLSNKICDGYASPPNCPSDTSLMAPGTCYDTLSGKMLTKTADGMVSQ